MAWSLSVFWKIHDNSDVTAMLHAMLKPGQSSLSSFVKKTAPQRLPSSTPSQLIGPWQQVHLRIASFYIHCHPLLKLGSKVDNHYATWWMIEGLIDLALWNAKRRLHSPQSGQYYGHIIRCTKATFAILYALHHAVTSEQQNNVLFAILHACSSVDRLPLIKRNNRCEFFRDLCVGARRSKSGPNNRSPEKIRHYA